MYIFLFYRASFEYNPFLNLFICKKYLPELFGASDVSVFLKVWNSQSHTGNIITSRGSWIQLGEFFKMR